jgi:hypothetical protein
MRAILVVAAFAASPTTILADQSQYDFLTVRYEGLVSGVRTVTGTGPGGISTIDDHTCNCTYRVGDKVSGQLFVDLRKAPPDSQSSPAFAEYAYSRLTPPIRGPSFVSGYAKSSADSFDRVQLQDYPIGDFFNISDHETHPRLDSVGRTVQQTDILDFVLAGPLDFIHGEGLVQSFNLSKADIDSIAGPNALNAGGNLQTERRWTDDVERWVIDTVKFHLTKLSVSPGICKAT